MPALAIVCDELISPPTTSFFNTVPAIMKKTPQTPNAPITIQLKTLLLPSATKNINITKMSKMPRPVTVLRNRKLSRINLKSQKLKTISIPKKLSRWLLKINLHLIESESSCKHDIRTTVENGRYEVQNTADHHQNPNSHVYNFDESFLLHPTDLDGFSSFCHY